MIINLVSGPRNVSTALMYSFAQRTDTIVSDEPFYGVYLLKTHAQHPGKEDVLKALPQEESEVRLGLIRAQHKDVLFVKNMAHHMEVLEDPFITGAVNVFLIRDPSQILASYAAVVSRPVMRDIGIAYQHALFSELQKTNAEPVVLDSGELLKDPSAVLAQLCHRCGIRYEQRMLHWPAGPKSYDGVWAPHWYDSVHCTTGFEGRTRKAHQVPEHLTSLYREARAYYEKLLPFSIKA